MIYTVTLNPALDRTVYVDDFSLGEVNRAIRDRSDAGGKGINVSKTLNVFDCESLALALLGGSVGKQIEKQLATLKVDCWPFYIEGETRTNTKIVDEKARINTDINIAGPIVKQEIIDNMLTLLLRIVEPTDIVILSGSLPQGVESTIYKRWIETLRTKGVCTFLDADGEAFKQGIQARPYLVKPNVHELSQYVQKELSSTEEILETAQELLDKGIECLIVSRGAEGALFITQNSAYSAPALSVEVGSTVGAGDALVAGMAYARQHQMEMAEAIKLSMATAAASVIQAGTQAPDKTVVEKLKADVTIQKLF